MVFVPVLLQIWRLTAPTGVVYVWFSSGDRFNEPRLIGTRHNGDHTIISYVKKERYKVMGAPTIIIIMMMKRTKNRCWRWPDKNTGRRLRTDGLNEYMMFTLSVWYVITSIYLMFRVDLFWRTLRTYFLIINLGPLLGILFFFFASRNNI